MPSVSGPQHRAMEAAAHEHSTLGIPAKVGKEFENADKGHHFKNDVEPSEIENDPMMDALDKIFDQAQILAYRLGKLEERSK